MNKKSSILLSVFILLSFAFYFKLWLFYQKYSGMNADPNIKYDIYGQDKYTYFGDGRFQVMNWAQEIEKLKLIDFKYHESNSFYLLEQIKKYLLLGDFLFVVGDFGGGTTDLNTGERIYFEEGDPAPQYLILNITTGDGQFFISFEDIPPVQQGIFQSELDNKCLENRTCYEKEEPSYNNPFNPFD